MADEEPVLSEVHMETCPPHTSSWCTRFYYTLLDQTHGPSLTSNQWQSVPVAAPTAAAGSLPAAVGAAVEPAKAGLDQSAGTAMNLEGPAAAVAAGAEGEHRPADKGTATGGEWLNVDADGDLVLPARPFRRSTFITIHHSLATPVSRCGEQVWLGACLLCDWLLHNRQLLAGQTVVDLGAGVGLVSIMAAQFAERVFLTDGDEGALQLASHNVAANGPAVQQGQQQGQAQLQNISVRQLDWMQLFDVQLRQLADDEVLELLNSNPSQQRVQQQQQQQQGIQKQPHSYAWAAADLAWLACAHIWLAADVVYNETITDAFMRAAHQLMCWQHHRQQQQQQHGSSGTASRDAAGQACSSSLPRLVVTVEKRFNFTFRDLDARAGAFEHFLTYVQQGHVQHQQQQQHCHGVAASRQAVLVGSKPLFYGTRLAVDSLPQVGK